MELIIVESSNKARKIQQILGGGFTVISSTGYVADLPIDQIGVDETNFEPILKLTEKGKVSVAKIKKFVNIATNIWIATDPGREGEAIASQLVDFLELKEYKRITFYEITKDSIVKSLQNPGKINYGLYQAQKARRVLDRLVGYKVSPVLSRLAGRRVSAGRVQSVVLRLIVEREQAIRAFKETSHFAVQLLLESNGSRWVAAWEPKAYLDEESTYVFDRNIAESVARIKTISITAIDRKQINKKPPPPFITTTLQKCASLELGWDATKTMQVAQKLFEAGLITYHITDNPNLADSCLPMLKAALKSLGFENDLAPNKNKYKSKKNLQEGSEGIRPTDFFTDELNEPDENAQSLYKLIRLRALASQMSSAKIEKTVISLTSQIPILDKTPVFISKSHNLLELGWMKLVQRDLARDKAELEEEQEFNLPELDGSQLLEVKSSRILDLKTKPPSRFTECKLISKLEIEGIGRPATYASILANIKSRGYIAFNNTFYEPEPTAELLVDLLVSRFSFIEIDYTKNIEIELDEISANRKNYINVMSKISNELDKNLNTLEKPHEYPCPICHAALRKLKGKHGWFWGCSRYGQGCKNTLPDRNGVPGKKIIDVPLSENRCPLCNKYLRRIKGKNAFFWSCEDFYDGCKFISDDLNGKPLRHYNCPKCGNRLRRLERDKRFFWSCSEFKNGCVTSFSDNNGMPNFK